VELTGEPDVQFYEASSDSVPIGNVLKFSYDELKKFVDVNEYSKIENYDFSSIMEEILFNSMSEAQRSFKLVSLQNGKWVKRKLGTFNITLWKDNDIIGALKGLDKDSWATALWELIEEGLYQNKEIKISEKEFNQAVKRGARIKLDFEISKVKNKPEEDDE
jgi:hypothetical protein